MLVYCDSFDHYTSVSQKYGLPGVAEPGITTGRTGSGLGCSDSGRGRGRLLGFTMTDIIMGFAYTPGFGNNERVVSFIDGGSDQFDLRLASGSNFLYVTRAGTTLGVASQAVAPSDSYYIEWRVVIHDSAGEVEIRIDTIPVLTLTGVDTRAAGTTVDRFYLQGRGGGDFQSANFDDLYLADSSGGVNDDFLGDVKVQMKLPDGNGASSDWVGSDANSVDNYLLVDETAPDDDTTYVESTTITDYDTYAYDDLDEVTGNVYGVQLIPRAKKTDVGTREIVTVARLSGGTEEDGAAVNLTTSYSYEPSMRNTKPGGGAWTISDVNGAQFGPKVET